MRGSLHAHCLLSVKDVPKLDRNNDEDVCAFIDKYITAVLPEMSQQKALSVQLMKKIYRNICIQITISATTCIGLHSQRLHLHTQFFSGQSHCPGGGDMITDAKKVLKAVQHITATTDTNGPSLSLDNLLAANGLDVDIYMDELIIYLKVPNVILKRIV